MKRYNDNESLEVPPATQEELHEEMKLERREKYPAYILMIVSLLLSVTLSIRFYTNLVNTLENGSDSHQLVLGEEKKSKELNTQYQPIRKIAYLSDQNIRTYDLDSSEDLSLTNDRGEYTAIAWRNKDEVSIAKTENSRTKVETYNVLEKNLIDNFDSNGQKILSMRWSHDGTQLAVLYVNGSDLILKLKDELTHRDIKTFNFSNKENLELNDSLYVRFSPNDEKLLVQNTLTSNENPSITVLDTNGEVISEIYKSTVFPTFAFFMSNDTIYYKKDDYLYVRSLTTGEETKVNDRIVGAFGFSPSPDKSKIAYWTHDWGSGIPTIWTYEIGTNSISRHKDNVILPSWVDDKSLVAIETKACSQCYRISEFEELGLIKFELNTKTSNSLLERNDISFFSSENF